MNIILYTLITTHITMLCMTLYIHRGLAHRTLEFNPYFAHVIRFWIWLTDGVDVKGWSTTHRIHHRYTDVDGDPHSPVLLGLKQVFVNIAAHTVWLRYKSFHDADFKRHYGTGVPEDWIEHNLYRKYHRVGVFLYLGIDCLLFGWWGLLVWCIQMVWTPIISNSFVNGIGHYCGYRNYKTRDATHNYSPIGIIIGGEELHNNHHAEPANPKFSRKWFEFDIGWMYIKIFEALGLVKIVERTK